mgnify:FL=1
MKKNILVMLSILIITILSGCQKKEEVSTYEQDRVAQYILDNVELVDGNEIKKIKFLSFEKPNTAAQIWSIDIEINDNIAMNLSENKLGDKLSIIYSDKEVKYISKERERRKIEIIYLKDGKHGR